jgi:putative polyhydroxyalkanoate system protein
VGTLGLTTRGTGGLIDDPVPRDIGRERMSDINLVRRFSLPIAIAKARVQKTADELAAEYNLESEWHGNTLHFHRSGLDGEMHVTDSEIWLKVNLSLLLKPLKGQIVSRIEDKFARLFPQVKAGVVPKKPHQAAPASR